MSTTADYRPAAVTLPSHGQKALKSLPVSEQFVDDFHTAAKQVAEEVRTGRKAKFVRVA